MDQQQFLSLLQGVQIPDTERVKAATTELRKNYYPNPESLLWLIEIFISHGDQAIRQQAAVEAQRLVKKHWKHISDAQKQQIREQLLQKTLNEEVKLVRHSGARVIAAIAGEDIEDGQWANLPDTLAQAAGSPQVSHREVGVFILFTLLETASTYFAEQTAVLFQILSKTIHDQESTDMKTQKVLKLFLEIFPQMVSVLKNFIDTKEEDRTVQAFEVFQTLLGCESALIAPHFKDLANFMLEIAADTNNENDARTQALSFLMQCTRYRKMKIQGTKDLGEKITMTSMQIATELEDDDDEDDETSPARSALGLLSLLAESLPPRQVIVPLLNVLPQFSSHQDPRYRQAGILSLGMCVEGAPDFVGTQMDNFLPIVFKLLEDPENGAHEHLIPALLKNLDAAMQHAAAGNSDKQTLDTMKASCGALDSLTEVSSLPAASAIGSLATSAEQEFLPFFKDTIEKLAQFVELKSSNDELDLRATPLMHASEEALHLDHPRLKETSYILWSVLAKVYEEEFTPFLEGVVTALAACLAQKEDNLEVELGEHAQDLLGQEVIVAGKKVKVAGATDVEDLDDMYDEDDDEEWDDLTAVTAVAMEKEVQSKTIEAVTPLVEHNYEGVRKTAISTMWRAYACLFSMMEDKTGSKWTPGLPLAVQPTSELIKMGEIVTTATMTLWEDEYDRGVVTDINRNVSSTLKLCGPAILAQPNFAEAIKNVIFSIVNRLHPCQQDLGDELESPDDDDAESSEYDWLVIDTALDLTSNLALALELNRNQTILQLTPKVDPVFAAVLSEPVDQLEVETREKVKGVVKFIGGSHPELLNGYEALQNL
ncbi:hypothetical protein DID88_007877 [Monilinia fructigena]|uniref:Importin N-terminal domain-containing protein n=1 Tax=Monilinia fructigena TaxID=38457 RepID=A0A395J3K3_9HELO|nr:hypothetical protein DID88_007877 [Monilinia fructigena]